MATENDDHMTIVRIMMMRSPGSSGGNRYQTVENPYNLYDIGYDIISTISYITCKRYAYDFLTQSFALSYADAIKAFT